MIVPAAVGVVIFGLLLWFITIFIIRSFFKGTVSHEMDFAFDDMYGYFYA
jgi:hypothetical protein